MRTQEDDLTTRHHGIAGTLISAALALGLCVAEAVPASADDPDVNPFRNLSCSCHQTAPAGSQALMEEIHRGLRDGQAAWLSGLPAATR